MTRYIYHVSVHNQDALCPDVHTVTAFINNTMGCEFVTLDMVYLLDDGITSYSYGHHRIGSL